jgi:bifunctional non-homologous end joining protein LigD
MAKTEYEVFDAGGREVRISSPGKVFFPEAQPQVTKRDLVQYYLTLAEPVIANLHDRPTHQKRFPEGAGAEPFFQKRIPDSAPEWLQTTTVTFPSGRTARVLTPNDAGHLVWGVNLWVIDWNPWQVRAPELDHPDELRVDLDPTPEASWDDVRQVALVCGEVLSDHGLVGYPKTSGSRGIHIYARIAPEHDFMATRRAALALAREVERRAPDKATSKWWKEERHGVFVDYNQNIRDRTVASAYSVRPTPDARVSTPLRWDEVADVEAGELRIDTVPALVARRGDPTADMDEHAGSLDPLLELSRVDEEERGLGDAPWPPHFKKQAGEPRRVQPSRARKPAD